MVETTAVRIKIKWQILQSYFIWQCHLNPRHHHASRGEKGVSKLSSTRVCKDHVYIRQAVIDYFLKGI